MRDVHRKHRAPPLVTASVTGIGQRCYRVRLCRREQVEETGMSSPEERDGRVRELWVTEVSAHLDMWCFLHDGKLRIK